MSLNGPALQEYNFFQLKGLNTYDPDETADISESPYATNFRMYAPKDMTKRVAISKRLGHAVYTVPVGETVDQQITSTTGAADQAVGLVSYQAQKFTAGATGAGSRVDINLKNSASATGPIILQLCADSSGSPGTVLATTSVSNSTLTSSYAYTTARFILPASIVSSTVYWIVAHTQSDGSGSYYWSSTTSATTAKTSTDGVTWSSTSYALNLKTYVATAGNVKGVTRFYRSTAAPVTAFAFNGNLYSVNDVTGAVTSFKSGLTVAADFYDFQTVNNKLYYVNGNDSPRVWDGTTDAVAGGSPPANASQLELYANRLFWLQPSTNYVQYSDAAAYETIQATSFIYIPSPNTADPTVSMIAYQGNLLFLTRNNKYVLYGTDTASFTLRESTAKKGAMGATAVCKDKQFVYFMSDDGVYRFNGGTDQKISQKVDSIIANIADKTKVRMVVIDNKLRIYYRSSGQAFNNNCLIYDLAYNEWLHDTNVYMENAITLGSQTDQNQTVTASSQMGMLAYADTGYNDLGAAIQFEYRTKYMSYGHPSAKHQVKRYYPHLRGQSGNYYLDCQVDADEQNSPVSNLINLNAASHLFGESGLLFGATGLVFGSSVLPQSRITVGGQALKHQFRFVQNGIDNPVDILGHSDYIKMRRPV